MLNKKNKNLVIQATSSMRCVSLPIHKISILFFLIFISLFAVGCSSDKPVYSIAEAEGSGYKISLMVPSKTISDGGSFSLTAFVTDPNGDPVPDEDEVVKFACSENEVKFEDDKCDVKNGVAATTAQWEDQSDNDNPDPPMNATITASYKGAIAIVQVILISKAF